MPEYTTTDSYSNRILMETACTTSVACSRSSWRRIIIWDNSWLGIHFRINDVEYIFEFVLHVCLILSSVFVLWIPTVAFPVKFKGRFTHLRILSFSISIYSSIYQIFILCNLEKLLLVYWFLSFLWIHFWCNFIWVFLSCIESETCIDIFISRV